MMSLDRFLMTWKINCIVIRNSNWKTDVKVFFHAGNINYVKIFIEKKPKKKEICKYVKLLTVGRYTYIT